MLRLWTPSALTADLLALQSTAERAGLALACPFSSSDEFESAIIRAKLDAGVYGPKRQRRWRALIAASMAAAAVLAAVAWLA